MLPKLMLVIASILAMSISHSYAQMLSNENSMMFLSDFLIKFNSPLGIVCLLCWKRSDQVQLWKLLSSLGFQAAVYDLKVNDASFRNVEENHVLLVTDANCDEHETVLKKASDADLLRYPFKWLVLNSGSSEIYADLPILINSRFYLAKSQNGNEFDVQLIYKIHESHQHFVAQELGTWRKDEATGFNVGRESFGEERLNMQGMILNITLIIVHNDTKDHLYDYKHLNLDTITKMGNMLCLDVANILNVSLHRIYADTWGYLKEGETIFPGMVGVLQNNSANLAVTPMSMTQPRMKVLDYIADPVKSKIVFMLREPPLSYVENVYTLPFDNKVWATCGLLMLISVILFYVVARWENHTKQMKEDYIENSTPLLQPKVADVVLFEVGALCQQGAEVEPRSAAGRTLTIFIFILITFLYTAYTAFIVALFQSTTDSIKTVEDLLTSDIKLGVQNEPYALPVFSSIAQTDPIRKALFEKKIYPKGSMENFMGVLEGIRRMRDEFFAFHVEYGPAFKTISDMFDENQKCGITEIDFWGIPNLWLASPKHSSYKKVITISYSKIRQYGLQSREYHLFFSPKPKCTNGRNIFKSIELIDCYYALILLAIGYFLAIVALLIEFSVRKFKNRGLKKLSDNSEQIN